MKAICYTFAFFALVVIGYNVFLWSITFDNTTLENNSNGQVEIIGHSGVGFHSWFPFKYFPSNSYGSLFKALNECKVDGIEVDIHLTLDQKFVLFHDSKLESKSVESGCPGEMTLEELRAVDYKLGAPFDWFHSERIIGLEEFIDSLQNREEFPSLHLDVRNWNDCDTPEQSAVLERNIAFELIKTLGSKGVPLDKILIISLSQSFLDQLKAHNNPYPVSFEIVGKEYEFLQWAIDYGVESVTVKPKLLTKELSKVAHEAGLKVITFGAKSKTGNKKLLELNPDAIQTDNILALKDLMGYE
jgi:glycerophosphoryl diester phosphodiesterase